MSESFQDQGVIQALLERFNTQRLPRALVLKEKVDRGEMLEEEEVNYLAAVHEDIRNLRPLVDRHPEYEALVVKGTSLYTEITEKALANAQK
jgi:acyl CoA:acetate/3-ketoacid CoA transferase